MEIEKLTGEEMILNMGPQHPSTHGVLRLELVTDGEIVKRGRPHLGYLHRCFEKHCEARPFDQAIPYTDRMDYISAMNQNLGYCLAVEGLAGLTVPDRAKWIRVVVAELNRIGSHLLAFGTYGMDIGAFTPFLYAFRDRERILDLFEMICGARLTYSYVCIGGVYKDASEDFVKKTRAFLDYFEPRIKDYNGLLSFNKIFIERTRDVAVISPKGAIDYGITGPNLRASGVRWDLRKEEPYSGYDALEFDVPVGKDDVGVLGDCWNRYFVRIEEMTECIKLVRQALDLLEKTEPGEHIAPEVKKRKLRPEAGEGYFRSETPRGELGFYIITDGKGFNPYRVKARSPSFSHMSIFHELCRGCMIADVVAIVGSLDVVIGETDR
jgi:NADH-quinone oxidoreductase subunit D